MIKENLYIVLFPYLSILLVTDRGNIEWDTIEFHQGIHDAH